MNCYEGRRYVVLGLGVSGKSAIRFLTRRGAELIGLDRDPHKILSTEEGISWRNQGVKIEEDKYEVDFRFIDGLIVSPGVPTTHPIYQAAIAAGVEVLGEVELACRNLNAVCVAITGSNGKTTTTLLTTHILNASGFPALAYGNIGNPLTEAIDQEIGSGRPPIVVLELSSWQLETMTSKAIDIGAILNITPNHLDRHGSMESYATAKFNIQNCLKSNGSLVIHDKCFKEFGYLLKESRHLIYGKEEEFLYSKEGSVCSEGEELWKIPHALSLWPSHDIENMLAAYAICRQCGVTNDHFIKALLSFKKPAHRIEFVRMLRGISFYNDSKATSVDPVIKAVEAMHGPTILIAGGVHKGASYEPWKLAFKNKVKFLCAIGETASQICTELEEIPSIVCKNLEEAIEKALKEATVGDMILISPGCSSYDMFKSYEERGDCFKELVSKLC